MNFVRIARAVVMLFMLVVLVVSGIYVLVYLYRWEWNRALISGVFLIASEVALASWFVLARLRELSTVRAVERAPAVRADPAERKPFRWLEDSQGVAVFVPFLLGAGVLLSVAAYLVERVARWSAPAGPTVDLGPIAFPGAADAGHARFRPLKTIVALLVAVVLVTLAIQRIGDITQTRPDVGPAPTATEFEVRIEHRRGWVSLVETSETAEALWVTCRSALPHHLRPTTSIVTRAAGEAVLRLVPGLGSNAERRLRGCVNDVLFSRVQATVVAVVHDAPGGAAVPVPLLAAR